jgi:hypothetical protein
MTTTIIIIVVIILIYVYYVKLAHPNYKKTTWNEIKSRVKSGDILLFSALDSINQIFMGSYYTHIGVIYRETPQSTPMFVESFNPYHTPFYPKELKSGIAVVDLEHRMNTYRGYIFYKELAKPITEEQNREFWEFIKYAKEHMEYDKNVIENEIMKMVLNTPFNTKTNCGQITMLILIKMGLLGIEHFHNRRKHHLIYTAGLKRVRGNSYKTPVYVFSEYYLPAPISFD